MAKLDLTEQFETLFNALVDPVAIVDSKGKILALSDRVEEITGFRKEKLLGKNLLKTDILTGKSKTTLLKNIVKRLAGAEITPYEVEVLTRDGEKIPCEINASKIMYKRKTAIMAVFRIITERKRIEAALRRSEEMYRRQFDEALDAIFIADAESGVLVDCNRAALELVGRERSELVGKHQQILHPPEETEGEFSRTFKQHLKEKEGQVLEAQIITKKGEVRDVAIKANVFELYGKKMIQGIFRDIMERKTIEKAIRKSEVKYRGLFENAVEGIFQTTPDGMILTANPALVRMLGYGSEQELKGVNVRDLYSNPKDRDVINRELADEGILQNVELVLKHKNGQQITVLENSRAIIDDQGKILYYEGALTDITERKRLGEKLAYERDLLHSLMDNIPDSIYFKDVESRFMRVNEAKSQKMGLKNPNKAVGKTDFDFYTEKFAQETLADEQRIMKTGSSLIGKVEKVMEKDGTTRWVSATKVPIKDSEGRVRGLIGISRDITKRKRMEELVKASEERYRTMFETTGTATVIIEDDRMISMVNNEFTKLSGYLREEVQGKMSMERFILKEDLDRVRDYHRSRIMDPDFAPKNYQFHFIDRQGEVKGIMATVTVIPGTRKVIASLLDITELEKIKETMKIKDAVLATSINRAREMEMKERFISVATHELRTPLISIKGYVDYILSGKQEAVPDKIKSSLTVVKRNTDRLLQLTNDLLDIRRLQSGRLELSLEPLDYLKVVDHCLKEIKPFVDEKKQILHIEVPEHSLPTQGDRIRLSQVVMNLLNNSIKFTPERGKITLKVKDEGNMIKTQVTDTGIGIQKEDLERVFKLFATIKKPTYFKGTGIGLSVSKDLVEAHGGKIWAESEGEGKGATFTFTLPKKEVK